MYSATNENDNPVNEEDSTPKIRINPNDNTPADMSPNEARSSETFLKAIKNYNETYINQVLGRFGKGDINQDQAKRQIDRLLDTHAYNTQLFNEKVGSQDSQTEASVLLTIPREIRQEILRYMLLSPVLGTRQAVKVWNGISTQESKYEIETNVLLVCRLLNEEGTAILYGENRFYNLCCDGHYWESTHLLMNANPISRYVEDCDPVWSRSKLAANIMGKVKHWRVDLTETTFTPSCRPYIHLREFCNNLSRLNPLTVEFLLVPWGMEADFHVQEVYKDRKKLLGPIQLLRNIPTVVIREVTAQDYMKAYQGSWKFPASPSVSPPGEQDQKAFEASLVELAQGDTSRESLFEKYELLLEYCQSFEQYQPFKKTMEYYPETFNLVLNQNTYHDELNTQYINDSFFLEHPVETGLCTAKTACNDDDFEGFKVAQASVLAYLEPQYKRLLTSFQALRELILKLKTETKILDPGPYFEVKNVLEQEKYQSDVGMLMFLLDNYVQAFKRDVPLEIQAKITFHEARYRGYYDYTLNPHCVFMISRLVKDALERRRSCVFLAEFRKTVDKVDAEFFKVVRARESLGLNALEYASKVDWELGGLRIVQSREFVDWKTDEVEGLFEEIDEYDDSLESWELSRDDNLQVGGNINGGDGDGTATQADDAGGADAEPATEITDEEDELVEESAAGTQAGGNQDEVGLEPEAEIGDQDYQVVEIGAV